MRLMVMVEYLPPMLARLALLMRRHLLPSMVILQQMSALLGRKPLEMLELLKDLRATLGRQCLESSVSFAQLLPLVFRHPPPFPQSVENLSAFFWWKS